MSLLRPSAPFKPEIFLTRLMVVLLLVLFLSPATRNAEAAPTPQPLPEPTITHGALSPTNGGPTKNDAESAVKEAESSAQKVEVLEDRTEFHRTWALPQGGFEAESTGAVVRFRDANAVQGWRDVDTTLVVNADGTVSPRAVPQPLVLGGPGDAADQLVSVEANGQSLAFSTGVDGPLPAPLLDGSTATYPGVLPGVDVRVEVRPKGFEQLWVANDRAGLDALLTRQASGDLGINAPVDTDKLTATPQANGSVYFADASKNLVSKVTPPRAWDAATAPDGTPLAEVPAELDVIKAGAVVPDKKAVGGDVDLSVTLDQEWLDDPQRKYPITIDPTYVAGEDQSPIFDTYVKEDATTDRSDSTYLPVGYGLDSVKNRSFLNFDLNAFQGASINSASLSLWGDNAGTCTPSGWSAYDASLATTASRWTAQPAVGTKYATSFDTKGFSTSCADGLVSIDMTSQLQSWSNDTANSRGMALVADNETTVLGYHRFWSSDASSNPPVLRWIYEDAAASNTAESDAALAIAQEPLDAAVDGLEEQVAQTTSWASSYGGAEVNIGTKAVTFYWSKDSSGNWNPAPAFVATVNSYNNGTTVNTTLAASDYSQSQLRTAAENTPSNDPDVAAVAVAADGSGLVVEVAPEDLSAKSSELSTRRQTARTTPPNPSTEPQAFVKEYRVGDGAGSAVATRRNDSSASPGWKGGARTRTVFGGRTHVCSTGFSTTKSSGKYMLTAAHCNSATGQTVKDGNDNTIGTVASRTTTIDTERLNASTIASRIYVGEWDNSSGTYKNVKSKVGSGKNTYVCTSGATSGTNCDLKIIDKDYFYSLEDGVWRWGALAQRQGNVRAVATGDSGGPVLKNTGVASEIKAAGIISGFKKGTEMSCTQGGVRVSNESGFAWVCARTVIYVKIGDATSSGYALKTI